MTSSDDDSTAGVDTNGIMFMEINSPKSSGSEATWSSIRVYLGVNRDKQRVLYVLMTANAAHHETNTSIASQINSAVGSHLINGTALNLLSSVTSSLGLGEVGSHNVRDSVVHKPDILPSIESLLQEPQNSFADAVRVISQLFCVSLFEEYLTASFIGLFLDNKSASWLQQYMHNNISDNSINTSNSTSINEAIQRVFVSPSPPPPLHDGEHYPSHSQKLVHLGTTERGAHVGQAHAHGYTPFDDEVLDDRDQGDQAVFLKSDHNLPLSTEAHTREYFRANESTNSQWYEHCNANPPEVLKSIIDVGFVRDLQKSFGYELRHTLGVAGEALDTHVTLLERSCAKLMTTLKGMYGRSGIAKPDPPESKSLSEYPLHLPSYIDPNSASLSSSSTPHTSGFNPSALHTGTSVIDATLEIATLLIYKARKHQLHTAQKFKHIIHNAAATCVKVTYTDNQQNPQELLYLTSHIEDILYSIYTQLQNWTKDEAVVRFERKLVAVSKRVDDIEKYKYDLVRALQTRTSSLLGLHRICKEDKDALSSFRQQFRFINPEEEPVLFESPATLKSRSGILSVTAAHICFHSNYALLAEPLILVIPWKTIHSIQLGTGIAGANGATVASPDFVTSATVGIAGQSTVGSSPNISSIIALVDNDNNASSMSVSGVTPDHGSRVFGFLALLLQSKYYECLWRSAADEIEDKVQNHVNTSDPDKTTRSNMIELAIPALKHEISVQAGSSSSVRTKFPKIRGFVASSLVSQYDAQSVFNGEDQCTVSDKSRDSSGSSDVTGPGDAIQETDKPVDMLLEWEEGAHDDHDHEAVFDNKTLVIDAISARPTIVNDDIFAGLELDLGSEQSKSNSCIVNEDPFAGLELDLGNGNSQNVSYVPKSAPVVAESDVASCAESIDIETAKSELVEVSVPAVSKPELQQSMTLVNSPPSDAAAQSAQPSKLQSNIQVNVDTILLYCIPIYICSIVQSL